MPHLHTAVGPEDHSLGPEDARVTLVEYGDFQCPHCLTASRVVNKLIHHFGSRLRFVYRHFPLTQIHDMAEPAAEMAEFAATADKFWPMHHALYANQSQLSPKTLLELASELGLDPNAAANAIDEGVFAERIQKDIHGGMKCGVHGTPTFFLNGQSFTDATDFASLSAAIEATAGE